MRRDSNRAWWLAPLAVLAVLAGTGALNAELNKETALKVAPADLAGEPVRLQLVEDQGAAAPEQRAIPNLEKGPGPSRVSLLVYMEPALKRDSIERLDLKNLARARGGNVRYEYKLLPNLINLRHVDEKDVELIRQMPGVQRVEIDQYHEYVLKLDESTPLVRGLQSQLGAAGISADGAGVRVCVGDTGIDMDHMMYSDRIDAAASWDFANDDSNPDDDHGHGSHVAGIAVGGTGLTVDLGCEGDEPFQGVAPAATLIGVKILNSYGGGTDSDIVAGIDHCADQSASGGQADVINLSIGTGAYSGDCNTHAWAAAAQAAVAQGVVVVAASGNEANSNAMGSPACGTDVIAVGATYKDDYPNCEDSTSNFNWGDCVDNSPSLDDIVCFSNNSVNLDVVAPGSVILSASNSAGGSSITGKSGTSMASPMVAGLVALILGEDPTLTPAEVRQIIRDGAIDMGTAGFDIVYGYGRIDVIDTLSQLTPCGGDPECDDGLWCNGAETCVAGSCQPGADPCPGESCDEQSDVCVPAPQVVYQWTMDSNPGWTTQGQWAWGQPTGGGGDHGGPDPTSGYTGANVIGYNLAGDYANSLAETHLTTTAIDCSDLLEVSLRFQRWLGVEQPAYDHAYIRVSNDGSSWTTVWQNTAEVADSNWTQLEYDISAVADGQSTVYVRWTMGTTDGSWQYCGWNIDDVQILGADIGGGGTCSDGVQNQGEDRIDCGGPCPACECTGDAACDDTLYCDGAETCDAWGACQTGTNVNCDDGVDCTDDSCNETLDACDNFADDAYCDDGAYCNGTEVCDPALDCQSGTAVNCGDGVGCTDDACNEGTDSCDNPANDANCDNGLFCDGIETCDPALDCQAGGDPCPGQTCDEAGDVCSGCLTDPECNDGLWCNGVESCDAGVCVAGVAVNCVDAVACTVDSCNEGTDSCDNLPVDANCDNGAFCDGAESCDPLLDCVGGTAVICDDGVGCTDDACNEGTDSCAFVANNANCDNGAFCDGAETCDPALDCQAGASACPGQYCDEGGDICFDCLTNGDCDDGLFCNGAETCDAGACLTGGDPCPGQTCDEGTDQCVSGPSAKFESGTVTAGALPLTVNLANSYVSPVVVCTMDYGANSIPTVTRVSNVTGSSFDLRLQNPSGGTVADETVSYLVVEEGVWTIDGVAVEAHTYLSTLTDENNSWVGVAQSYGQSYTNPVVLGQVMTENDPLWSAFWNQGDARTNPPSPTVLRTGKMVGEDPTVARAAETVGWIVIESGHGTIAGVEYEAALGADTVLGIDNSPPFAYSFNSTFSAAPTVTVMTMAAMDGNNGGWAQSHGAATATTLYLSVDEDQAGDTERAHTSEQVGYLVFAGPAVYPAEPECVIDPDCDDGLYCNGAETCSAGSCVAGTAVTCDDGVGCTDDVCDEATDSCDFAVNDGHCDNGLFCDGAETCDAVLDCQAGGDPCPGQGCDEGTDQCFSGPSGQLEWGSVTAGATAITVPLAKTYTSPVIVCSVQYDANTNPVVARVSNVTANSFDLRLQDPSGGASAADNVSYLVVEEGVWTLDGVNIEAQTYLSTVTDDNNSWVGEARSYGQGYTSPVVLGQVMSENDPAWSVFWCQGDTRTNPPSATALRTGKTVCEDPTVPRANETVGIIVFEAGHGTLGGVEYEAALGADSVRGVGNSPPYTYTFNTTFASAPGVVMTTMAGVDGGNGGWSQSHGPTLATTTTLYLSVDEDIVADTERAHTPEQVGYVVFGSALAYP